VGEQFRYTSLGKQVMEFFQCSGYHKVGKKVLGNSQFRIGWKKKRKNFLPTDNSNAPRGRDRGETTGASSRGEKKRSNCFLKAKENISLPFQLKAGTVGD